MAVLSKELGIDLGTVRTRISEGGQVILQEPTVVAIAIDEQKIVAVGQEAQDMSGRVPESLEVAYPLQNGVIADYEVTEKLLSYLIKKISGPVRFFRPKVMMTIPHGVTSVERRAVHEAVLEAVKRDVFLIQQPMAAALGVDLPFHTPTGNMIISMGGGSTQSAVLAVYGIVSADTLRIGGLELDAAISSYVRRKYGLIVAQPTAERIKINVGAAVSQDEESSIEVQGQDQVSGLPRPLTLTTGEVVEALQDPLSDIVESARRVLEKTPPELVSDIIDRGIALCGGTSLLRGIDKLLTKELGVPAYLVDNPLTCVAEGASIALQPSVLAKIKRNLPPV
ncbi:MAG: rod shape-determining protein [Anaerolineae bacterium]|nr:rod shape-determining protein [Anaerolineae bacterium]